jgi:hypothetical protein
MEFVNTKPERRHSYIRTWATLKTRPEEVRRSELVGQPLILEIYQEELKPIAVGRYEKQTGKLLRVDIFLPSRVVERFLFH